MIVNKEFEDYLRSLVTSELDENGKELLNPVPLFIDVTPRPPTLQEQIQTLMRVELSRRAAEMGHETIEEANDFFIEGDFEGDEEITIHELGRMMAEDPDRAVALLEDAGVEIHRERNTKEQKWPPGPRDEEVPPAKPADKGDGDDVPIDGNPS